MITKYKTVLKISAGKVSEGFKAEIISEEQSMAVRMIKKYLINSAL